MSSSLYTTTICRMSFKANSTPFIHKSTIYLLAWQKILKIDSKSKWQIINRDINESDNFKNLFFKCSFCFNFTQINYMVSLHTVHVLAVLAPRGRRIGVHVDCFSYKIRSRRLTDRNARSTDADLFLSTWPRPSCNHTHTYFCINDICSVLQRKQSGWKRSDAYHGGKDDLVGVVHCLHQAWRSLC